MRRVDLALSAGLALLSTQTRADQSDPLAHADVVSEIGLARVADEAGDGALSYWLRNASRRDLQLIALRASPYAFAPERLIPHIAPILCSRDPILAPEAGLALSHIAKELRPSELAAREALRADLRAAQKALGCIDQQPSPVRADLASAALVLSAALAQL